MIFVLHTWDCGDGDVASNLYGPFGSKNAAEEWADQKREPIEEWGQWFHVITPQSPNEFEHLT